MYTYSLLEKLNSSGFQIAALCICISCLYFTLIRYYTGKLQNKLFLAILLNILVSSLCATGYEFLNPLIKTSAPARTIQSVNLYLFFLLHALLSPLFCFYMTVVTGAFRRLKKKYRFLYELPIYISELLVLTNPLTHWVYSFDETNGFIRHWGENLLYIVGVLYFVVAAILALFLWRAIDKRKNRTISYFFIIVALGTVLQFFFQGLQTELFAEALALTGVMITLENEDIRKDPRTGIYNMQAFAADVRDFMIARYPFCIICVKMSNPQNLMQIVGQANIENLTKMTAEYLATLVPKHNIYYTPPGTFLILCDGEDKNEHLEIARAINDRFHRELNFQDSQTLFNAAVFCAEVPKDLGTREEIMALIGSPLNATPDKKNDIYYGSDLNYFTRRTLVEKAILNGLSNHSFEVYYQPIYDTKDMSIRSGEALLRFRDPEIGEILPEEFLPVAERNGLIFELGDFVLEEVCKFLNSGIPVEMGVETLNINLSLIQCIQASYADRIIQKVSRFDIDPKRITFEISESAAVADFDGLAAFVAPLKNHGFRFSVDDYGIGYSNIHSIFSLDVDLIKIDRTILWDAEQNDIGRIIMESSVNMIKRMGKKILISGVESQTQIELAAEFGVNYLQGFFFSNPVTQNEFIGILKATQLARMEEQRALAANEAMSAFLANMSHEIRTPINAVLGMDEMILRESEDDRIIEYARNIKGAGRTLLSLINDILDFSKIEAGNMDIVESEYELSSVLGDVINMVQLKATQKGLKLLVDANPTTPESLYGDEMRIRQIMVNILNNAVKYTKVGTVSLKISYETIDRDNINLIITVRDTGIGIKEEDIDKLFRKFQRLDQNHNNTIEGSGLGLAITHQLLELMHGDIAVESTYGEGSTFTITLPQRVVRSEGIGDFRKKFSKANENTPQYRESFRAPDARILVVDDTPMNLVVVKELLKKTLLQVDVAHSGNECLEMVKKHSYDLIFLDYRMPIMDGVETLRQLSGLPDNRNSETPVVALTANAISGARERFLKDGFDDYLTKPIDAAKLEELLLMYIPAGKIQPAIEEKHRESTSGSNLKSEYIEKYSEAVNDLDIAQGIQNCGSEEAYRTVLRAFQDDISGRVDALKKAYQTRDWNRYAVDVHAIKSSARIIGAQALSNLAQELELAAEKEEAARIEADHENLLAMYEGYLHIEFEKHPQDGTDTRSKPEMTEEIWRDACTALHDFARNMDMDNSLLVLTSMDDYLLSDKQLRAKEEIRTLVSQLMWEELIEKLDEILK